MRPLLLVLTVLIPITACADEAVEHTWLENDWRTELVRSESGNYKCITSKGGTDQNDVMFGGGFVYGIDAQGHFTPLILLLGDDDPERVPHVGERLHLFVDDKDLGEVTINELRGNGVGAVMPESKASALMKALRTAQRFVVVAPRSHYVFISNGFDASMAHLLRDCPRLAAHLPD